MTDISGSQIVIKTLLRNQTEVIFGYPGGAIMPIYDALFGEKNNIRHILVRHEQGAIHAAEGYARTSGKAGVCFATSGPGATNLITGLLDALMDSVPLVCITGQVSSKFLGLEAFQEADVIGAVIPVTKWCVQVTKASEIEAAIDRAFMVANSGRPGPVVVDITKDAQFELAGFPNANTIVSASNKKLSAVNPSVSASLSSASDDRLLAQAATLLNNARKPLLLVGHGVVLSKAESELARLAEISQAPFACTLHGLCGVSQNHKLFAGMLGMHGNYAPNVLTNEADVIFAVGMRFDDRVTGDTSRYAKKAKIIHLDISQSEMNKVIMADVSLDGDAKTILNRLMPLIEEKDRSLWLNEFRALDKKEHALVIEKEFSQEKAALSMGEVVRELGRTAAEDAIILSDVGQHQMSVARYFGFTPSRKWISSGGLGTMGFGVPAAMGAVVAAPKRQVITVVGDGGFQMTLQELGTIAQEKMPVKIVILNNNYLGMVRQWQQLFFDSRYSFVDMTNPDFVKLADAYGIPAWQISDRANMSQTLQTFLQSEGPGLLEVIVEKEQNIFPMIPVGASVSDIQLEAAHAAKR